MITWGQPLSPVLPSEARRFTSDSSRTEVRSERQFRKKISCGAAKSRALSKQFSVEAWLKPCPPDLASRSCTGETPAPTSRIGRPLHTQLLPCSRTFARRRQSIRRLRALVTNRSDLGKQLAHAHARKRFKERRHLRRHLGDVAGDLVHSGGIPIAGGNNRDLVHVGQWAGQRFDHFRHVGE